MYSRSERFKEQSKQVSVPPNHYYTGESLSQKQHYVPFLTSNTGSSVENKTDLVISAADYYPLYRKHRIKLGNALRYTEKRNLKPLPDYLRSAKKNLYSLPPHQTHFEDRFGPIQTDGPKMAVRIQTEITVVNGPEKFIKMHKIENVIDFSKLSGLHLPDDPHWLDNYIINEDGPAEDEPQLLIARFRSQGRDRTNPNLKSIRNCVQVIPLNAKESDTEIQYEIRLKPKKIKKVVRPKDTGPGPSSYNIPSMFGKQKSYYFHCANQKRNPQLRYLDLMVSNVIRENIPGPGKYNGPKSSFDKSPKSPKPFVFPTCSRKQPETQDIAPNRYNVNYRLVEKSAPKWPFKGMERNTTPTVIKNIPGPSEYTVNTEDIAYKINKQLLYNRQHLVTKPPFNSITERHSTIEQTNTIFSEEDQKTLDKTNECIRPYSTFVSKTGRTKLQVQSSGVDKYYNTAQAVDNLRTKTSHNKRRTPFNQTSQRFAKLKTQRSPGPADYLIKKSTYCVTNRLNFGTYSERQPKLIPHGPQTYELPEACRETVKTGQFNKTLPKQH